MISLRSTNSELSRETKMETDKSQRKNMTSRDGKAEKGRLGSKIKEVVYRRVDTTAKWKVYAPSARAHRYGAPNIEVGKDISDVSNRYRDNRHRYSLVL